MKVNDTIKYVSIIDQYLNRVADLIIVIRKLDTLETINENDHKESIVSQKLSRIVENLSSETKEESLLPVQLKLSN